MWEIYEGHPFVLEGYKAEFYLDITQGTADDIAVEGEYITGCVLLDNASIEQKIYLIHFCLSALLKKEVSPPPLTHILEATVYLPFAYLEEQISIEIEQQEFDKERGEESEIECFYNRLKTEKAYRNILLPEILKYSLEEILDTKAQWNHSEDDWEIFLNEELKNLIKDINFSYESTDKTHWQSIINDLAHDLVLGDDEDFKFTSINPQAIDGIGEIEMLMGITDEYLTNKLPKVSRKECEQALSEILQWKL